MSRSITFDKSFMKVSDAYAKMLSENHEENDEILDRIESPFSYDKFTIDKISQAANDYIVSIDDGDKEKEIKSNAILDFIAHAKDFLIDHKD